MEEFIQPMPSNEVKAFVAARRGRNIALLVALLASAALFYAIAMVKMGKMG
jgi:hypothetical protein